MTCTYDLEGDELYSVKWYKGRQEFYRYLPKEHPHNKVFPLLQIDVDVSINCHELRFNSPYEIRVYERKKVLSIFFNPHHLCITNRIRENIF